MAAIVAEVALAAPRNGIVEIAGPERVPLNECVARYPKAVGHPREVVRDPEARYLGGRVEERSLVPLGEARLGRIGFDDGSAAHRQEPDPASEVRPAISPAGASRLAGPRHVAQTCRLRAQSHRHTYASEVLLGAMRTGTG